MCNSTSAALSVIQVFEMHPFKSLCNTDRCSGEILHLNHIAAVSVAACGFNDGPYQTEIDKRIIVRCFFSYCAAYSHSLHNICLIAAVIISLEVNQAIHPAYQRLNLAQAARSTLQLIKTVP